MPPGAAASLREVFEELARDFQGQRPGLRVRLNLAGSQELRTQIEQGAPADHFVRPATTLRSIVTSLATWPVAAHSF